MSAKKRSFLSDELADMFNPAPKVELDPEALEKEDKPLDEDNEWEVDPEHTATKRAKEKGLRMRGDISLQGGDYSGKKTTRAALFGDESEMMQSDGDDDGDGGGDDEDAEEGDGGSSDGEGAELADGSDEEDDDGDDDDDDEEGSDEEKTPKGAKDGKMAELEQEYDELQREDAEAVVSLREKSAKERTKGISVRNQQVLYERSLETRIHLQKVIGGSQRMPSCSTVRAIHQLPPSEGSSVGQLPGIFSSLIEEASKTLTELVELQEALLQRVPGIESQQDEGRDEEEPESSESLWERLDGASTRLGSYRNTSIDRWHRRTVLSSGASALRNSLRALNQSVSNQVSAMMRDPAKFVERTQLTVAARPRQLCETTASLAATANGDAPQEEAEMNLEEMRDSETYDDGEFYQQLLREFLDRGVGGAAGGGAALQRLGKSSKKRKAVDRRASKGRKVRYAVQDKMVGFMAPTHLEPPAFTAQLFANLFGHAGR